MCCLASNAQAATAATPTSPRQRKASGAGSDTSVASRRPARSAAPIPYAIHARAAGDHCSRVRRANHDGRGRKSHAVKRANAATARRAAAQQCGECPADARAHQRERGKQEERQDLDARGLASVAQVLAQLPLQSTVHRGGGRQRRPDHLQQARRREIARCRDAATGIHGAGDEGEVRQLVEEAYQSPHRHHPHQQCGEANPAAANADVEHRGAHHPEHRRPHRRIEHAEAARGAPCGEDQPGRPAIAERAGGDAARQAEQPHEPDHGGRAPPDESAGEEQGDRDRCRDALLFHEGAEQR